MIKLFGKNFSLQALLLDIRFYLFLFFLLRLIGIENAPLESSHNWRQSLTNMIARNFYEEGPNLLYPKIDMAGEKSGIIGSEFPFFNYLIYLTAEIFGYQHWYGRLINLSFSTLGIYAFYKLVKELMEQQIAFYASLLLCFSIWFAFSRKIMPDTFSVSLMLMGLYAAYRYLKLKDKYSLFFFFILSSLSMLCKIPALLLFGSLGFLLFDKSISTNRKVIFIAVASLSFLLALCWYFYWVPHLVKNYHFALFFPRSLSQGWNEILALWPKLLSRFYFDAFHSYLAFGCCLLGLYFFLKTAKPLHIIGFALVSIVFSIFILKTGKVFPNHSYYIIPFVPVMAILGAFTLKSIPKSYSYLLLLFIGIESIANQQHDFFIKEEQHYKLRLEALCNAQLKADKLVLINGGDSPQSLYFANRRGWTLKNESFSQENVLDSLNQLGAHYLIIDKHQGQRTFQKVPPFYEDQDYAFYNLN